MTVPVEKKALKPALLLKLGFWFFLIKGLLWLAIPAAGLWLGLR